MNNTFVFSGLFLVAVLGSTFSACTSGDTVSNTSTVTTGECAAGAWDTCTTTAGATGAKQCDAEGHWQACVDCKEGSSQSCTSACGTGTEVCVEGKWVNCTAPAPEQEICDGIDNNCDGQVDEVCTCVVGTVEECYDGPSGTKNVGICKGGQHTCVKNGVASKWTDCVGEVTPAGSEDCANQLDDNCNGSVNEGCSCTVGATQACGSSVGECKQGTQTCALVGGVAQWGACANEVKPQPETGFGCDGKDNDCDGVIDNGLPLEQGEPNESCAAAFNVGTVNNDGATTTFTKSIYPAGDVDWLRIHAAETATNLCTPFDPQCQIVTVEVVQPTTAGAVEEVSITDACTSPTLTVGPFTAGTKSYAWQGICLGDDSADLYVKVAAAASATTKSSCTPYSLKVTFTTENVDCCTLVACTGASDTVCANSGCGACSNGFCAP